MIEHDEIIRKASQVFRGETPRMDSTELRTFVDTYIQRKDVFLNACERFGSPLYLIEEAVILERARRFSSAFQALLPQSRAYYAMKSNNHPAILPFVVKAGIGIDVSSGLELQAALDAGAEYIIFSGPGKTPEELSLAVLNEARVTVLMDSFAELGRLQEAAASEGIRIRAGIRISVDNRGLWRKFGIPMGRLIDFFSEAETCPNIELSGLQFHTSWNLNADGQVRFIARLAEAVSSLPEHHRSRIQFIDIGGGFWPVQGDWLQPAGTPEGQLVHAVTPSADLTLQHHRIPSSPIEDFARDIGEAVRRYLFPLCACSIWTEPGRWICHDSMSLLLKVVDRKADDLVITDGGTNIVGWERFETDYFPVINLTRPSLDEHECYVMGSLCTPRDLWGYAYFGSDIQPGDTLLIPTQGAYTYSLRQHFIKPLPESVILTEKGDLEKV